MNILLTILYCLLTLIAVLIILLALLLFLDFSVIISTEGKSFKLFIKALGIKMNIPLSQKKDKPKKEKKKPKEEKEETEQSVMEKFLNMRNNFTRQKNAIGKTLSYLKYKISIDKIGAIGEIGTGNAATSGMAYGGVQAFVNTVFGFLGQFFSLKEAPDLKIDINYNKAVFNIRFMFMIRTKLIYFVKAFLIYKKSLKGGK